MSVSEAQPDPLDERRRRRSWSLDEKRRIVAETYEPGASVSKVARRHDVNTNMVFTWRRHLRPPSLMDSTVSFVPAAITTEPGVVNVPAVPGSAGRMEIVFTSGERLIFGSDVDAGALGRVVKLLAGR